MATSAQSLLRRLGPANLRLVAPPSQPQVRAPRPPKRGQLRHHRGGRGGRHVGARGEGAARGTARAHPRRRRRRYKRRHPTRGRERVYLLIRLCGCIKVKRQELLTARRRTATLTWVHSSQRGERGFRWTVSNETHPGVLRRSSMRRCASLSGLRRSCAPLPHRRRQRRRRGGGGPRRAKGHVPRRTVRERPPRTHGAAAPPGHAQLAPRGW